MDLVKTGNITDKFGRSIIMYAMSRGLIYAQWRAPRLECVGPTSLDAICVLMTVNTESYAHKLKRSAVKV